MTTAKTIWAIATGIVVGVVCALWVYNMAPAQAQPGCTASGLTSALATVASGTSGFLDAHPEAEAAVNSASEESIRTYFAAHQSEWQQLQGIASPLRNLRNSCSQQVSAGDVARLFDAMAS
jgi:heme-binding protein